MISYIKGIIADIYEDVIIVENNNIGYNVRISANTALEIGHVGSEVKIHTYLYVKEDAMQLFGFITRDDLSVFKLLLTVNGIGPKGALGILSALTADELRFAVLGDDAKTISKAPGVGAKTAKRLIIELKDKLKLEDAFEEKIGNVKVNDAVMTGIGSSKSDAVQALIALGYSNTEALQALTGIEISQTMSTEDILKAALKNVTLM